ncbi:MAG TPA: cysteine hydrolase family protein [Planctomycetaceae bacterium]|jgi:nicotinamidase-related amidase|nr:cysteine hydrolase family protein [Planctomycetaceae bacterium]
MRGLWPFAFLIIVMPVQADDVAVRPVVPGSFAVKLQRRIEAVPKSGQIQVVVETQEWKAAETAIIICDMWDNHYCQSSAQRVKEMTPRMNAVLTAARNHGVQIIHSPSGVTHFYADTSYRRRMQEAPRVIPPFPLESWCHRDEKREPELPVDVSKQACDDPEVGPAVRVFHRQNVGLDIIGYDGISDNGDEIYGFCKTHGIKNIVMMGVHTNMCVLGRPFGIRQLVRLGFNVALARDLTDAMYDPRQPPFVSHTRGTEMVIEHIEHFWCPSLEGADLTKVISGSADPSLKPSNPSNSPK